MNPRDRGYGAISGERLVDLLARLEAAENHGL